MHGERHIISACIPLNCLYGGKYAALFTVITMTDNTATNDITGDRITTKRSTIYAENYGNIDFSIKLEPDHFNELLKDDKDGFNVTPKSK